MPCRDPPGSATRHSTRPVAPCASAATCTPWSATSPVTHAHLRAPGAGPLRRGDGAGVRARYDAQLRPEHGLGCRALVDTGSLLFRWALTPDATDVPGLEQVAAPAGRDVLERPATPFLAMHSAVTLLALDDWAGLDEARALLDARLDRRHSPRDRRWRDHSGQADRVA